MMLLFVMRSGKFFLFSLLCLYHSNLPTSARSENFEDGSKCVCYQLESVDWDGIKDYPIVSNDMGTDSCFGRFDLSHSRNGTFNATILNFKSTTNPNQNCSKCLQTLEDGVFEYKKLIKWYNTIFGDNTRNKLQLEFPKYACLNISNFYYNHCHYQDLEAAHYFTKPYRVWEFYGNIDLIVQCNNERVTIFNSSSNLYELNYGIDNSTTPKFDTNMHGTMYARIGSDVTFRCRPMEGVWNPNSWMKDDEIIKTDERISYMRYDNKYEMKISNVKESDSGLYICVVSNNRYTESFKAYLTVSRYYWILTKNAYLLAAFLGVFISILIVASMYFLRSYWNKYRKLMSQSEKLQKSLKASCRIDIQKRDLKVGSKIGAGHYGEVLEGMYRGKRVAIKMLKNILDQDQIDSLEKEHKILTKLNHPNIINVIGACTKLSKLSVVVEYCENGNLKDYLLKLQSTITVLNTVNKKFLIEFGIGICSGMEYLGSMNIIHRDLAARNVLLTSDRVIKLCDFGLARHLYSLKEYKMKNLTALPMKWMAIESMVQNMFSSKSDVWSFGVCCWEIFSFGDEPYRELDGSPFSVIQNSIVNGVRLEQPEYCPNDIFLAMEQCWNSDPDQRPTFSQLIEIFNHNIDINADSNNEVLRQCVSNNDDRGSQPRAKENCTSPSPYTQTAIRIAAGQSVTYKPEKSVAITSDEGCEEQPRAIKTTTSPNSERAPQITAGLE